MPPGKCVFNFIDLKVVVSLVDEDVLIKNVGIVATLSEVYFHLIGFNRPRV